MELIQATPPFPYIGEIASILAAAIWAIAICIFTKYGSKIAPPAMNLYKNLVAIIFIIVSILLFSPELPTNSNNIIMLALSGIIGIAIGDTALFSALNRLGAQITSATQSLSPVLCAIIAIFFLSETLTFHETIGMAITVTAITIVIFVGKKGTRLSVLPKSQLTLGIGLASVSAFSQAIGVVIARAALQETHILYGTLLRMLPAVIILFFMTYRKEQSISLKAIFAEKKTTIMVTLAAFMGTFLGLVLLSIGAKYTKAGISASLTSTFPIWVIPISKFILNEKINWQTTLWTILAVSGIGIMVGA